MKAASKAVEKPGRVLVLVNVVNGKCNIVVASSSPRVNAGGIAGELSKKLGGGGRGDARLGVGGGKSGNAEKVIEEFEIF
jgi:alanyl-tRNA synthetase